MFEEYRCQIEHDNCNCIFICLPVGHRKGRIAFNGVRFCISMDYSFNSFKINLHCYKLKDFFLVFLFRWGN